MPSLRDDSLFPPGLAELGKRRRSSYGDSFMPHSIDDYILTGRVRNPPVDWAPLHTVNMTAQELRAWAEDPRSKLASTETGQESLRYLPEVLLRPRSTWTQGDYRFAWMVDRFNTRHLRAARLFGAEVSRSGWSKRHIALRNWGHDPSSLSSPAYDEDLRWLQRNRGAASRRARRP